MTIRADLLSGLHLGGDDRRGREQNPGDRQPSHLHRAREHEPSYLAIVTLQHADLKSLTRLRSKRICL